MISPVSPDFKNILPTVLPNTPLPLNLLFDVVSFFPDVILISCSVVNLPNSWKLTSAFVFLTTPANVIPVNIDMAMIRLKYFFNVRSFPSNSAAVGG